MVDPATFLKVKRRKVAYRSIPERVKDSREVSALRSWSDSQEQASRCIDCGIPFCHWTCPIGNVIPEWNDLIARGEWEKAYYSLQATNNLPEMTGRLCPATCEDACVFVQGKDEATTIREDELAVIEYAFTAGFVKPNPPARRTGKKVAVVGSGPAGLCCADQLNKAGHSVVVFERDAKPGGLLRYGIPDFKLEKWVIDRRLRIWEAEGIEFKNGINVGIDYPTKKLFSEFDAVCLTGGARLSRDLKIEGRDLNGIHFAMDYLAPANRRISGEDASLDHFIDAKDKRVVVIGGGDTGADCVGTAHRQGASRVVQIELLPCPPRQRGKNDLWPDYPKILRSSSSHEEGGERLWSILTKKFLGNNGSVKTLSCVKLKHDRDKSTGKPTFKEIPGTEFEVEADLVLLAMGFVSCESEGLLSELAVSREARGNVATDSHFHTSIEGVFAAGDMHRGQSVIVWAIAEGRIAAHEIDTYLMGYSKLPGEPGRMQGAQYPPPSSTPVSSVRKKQIGRKRSVSIGTLS